MPSPYIGPPPGVSDLRKEVLDFIVICERIQGLLGLGGGLTEEESAIIEMSGTDLLSKLKTD